MVGPGKVATSVEAEPAWLNPQMVWAGMFVSDVILKFVFARIGWIKYCWGGYWLKNWKQSDPALSVPLNCPRPSKGRLVAGLIALLGHNWGGAPNCSPGSVSGRAGNCGGIGRGSIKGARGWGLHPGLQLLKQKLKVSVNPVFGIRTPALVMSPIFMRSRRVKPAFTSSNLFCSALYTSRLFAILPPLTEPDKTASLVLVKKVSTLGALRPRAVSS